MNKNRKQLPTFKALTRKIDIAAVLNQCREDNLFDYSKFNDIKKSADSRYKNFLVGNSFSKNKFFIREDEEKLEGELYKQLYLTGYKYDSCTNITEKETTTKHRLRRIQPNHPDYIPELDEHNFGKWNDNVKGAFAEVLSSFKSPLTRVRLAVLMPNMTIKKHIDYDPSYICRYHIPLITSTDVVFGMEVCGEEELFNMVADGSIYFFNSGLPHWVSNNSNDPRLHLIIDTNGQLDLDT